MYTFLDMTFEEVAVLIAHAKAEVDETSMKPYFPLYVIAWVFV
jgi:hypothetical protein